MEGKRNVSGPAQPPAAPTALVGGKGTIRGRVVDGASVQQPIRKARLRLYRNTTGEPAGTTQYGQEAPPYWKGESQADGTFEITVDAADYVLVAEAYGVDSERATVHVQGNCWADVPPLRVAVGLGLSIARPGSAREQEPAVSVPSGAHVLIEAVHQPLVNDKLLFTWQTTAGTIVERGDARTAPRVHLDTASFTGPAIVTVTMSEIGSASEDASTEVYSEARAPQTIGGGISVALRRTSIGITEDLPLWLIIRRSTDAISFKNYRRFVDLVLCNALDSIDAGFDQMFGPRAGDIRTMLKARIHDRHLPFTDVEAYRLLKVATEAFLMVNCGVALQHYPFEQADLDDLIARVSGDTSFDLSRLEKIWDKYLLEVNGSTYETLPYLETVIRKFPELALKNNVFSAMAGRGPATERCYGVLLEKLTAPCLLELIWSYWHEEGMLAQTLNAISVRFQNRRGRGVNGDPLANMEIDPLRPLNNLLWGYIQDEQHRLSVVRRAYEYDHHYGLRLQGRAVPAMQTADSRSQFLRAFHHLLNLCGIFFQQDDDTTVIADGFPVLNALKETHLILSQGAHNQFGDLPSTARVEMLMQQWLLARPEFREFLPTRVMVAYPEEWMDRVDAMKKLQGWSDVNVTHFRDLAIFGEKILLSIRFGAWADAHDVNQAKNWSRFWRAEIQGYIHAYRAVTGVDVSVEPVNATLPSVLLRQRLAQQRMRA